MKLTQEQQNVLDYVSTSKDGTLTLVNAVAGSGKTALLISIAESLDIEKGLYLAYNKSISIASKRKFPKEIDCRTTHSLAYRAVVKPLGLKVGFFNENSIKEADMTYSQKATLVEDIREFCLSKYLSYDDFSKHKGKKNKKLANKYLNLMYDGKIQCTHDFYMKVFHTLLADDDIEQIDYDIIMLDEAGDLNEVTLEIFRLLTAKKKIAVGDPHQNIYQFNHTINCFKTLKKEGTEFRLSKSFRVPDEIAKKVNTFCTEHLDYSMSFKGVKQKNKDIKTIGFISRTNVGLVNKIIELTDSGTPYGLVRNAYDIFKVPLMVSSLKYKGKIYLPEYADLQGFVDEWHENRKNVKDKYPTLFKFIAMLYETDPLIKASMALIGAHGKNKIFEAYESAKSYENKQHNLMLLTAHSSKGLEFDEVIIAPDMENMVTTSISKYNVGMASSEQLSDKAKEIEKSNLELSFRESMNLYYVAVTRALVSLSNANYLGDLYESTTRNTGKVQTDK